MVSVGIIANPASGKDIRRLVSHASVFDNNEKVAIVRRVLLALDALGVDEVLLMPDSFQTGRRAQDSIDLRLTTTELDMLTMYDQDDSTRAARLMTERGARCIITLGGDGTNRAVAKGAGPTPFVPISTGTNNVFPQLIEGTVAGLAAGLFATNRVPADVAVRPTRRLEVERNSEMVDLALVDIAVYADLFVAARAVWDLSRVRAVATTRVVPGVVGLSAIAAALPAAVAAGPDVGAWVRLGPGSTVLAPVAPGKVMPVHVADYSPLRVGDAVPVDTVPSILALDGEREFSVRPGDHITLRLTADGPRVLDIHATLQAAALSGAFTLPP